MKRFVLVLFLTLLLTDYAWAVDGDPVIEGGEAVTVDVTTIDLNPSAGVAITADDGDITFTGQGNGSDEDLNLNLDDTSNEVVVSSTTGVTVVDFGTINVETDVVEVDTNIQIGSDPADAGAVRLDNATVIGWEDATEATITHVDDTGLLINLELEVDGTLDADGIVVLGDGGDNFSVASDGIDIDTSGNVTNAGTIGSGAITSTGAVGGTDLTASDDVIVQDDVQLDSDAALIQLGEDQDVTLTHVADTGVLLTGTTDEQLQIGDSGTYLNQSTDGTLNVTGDTIVDVTAPNIKMSVDAAAYLNIATADGGATTISQVSDGTDGIVIGDGGDTVSIASSALDLDTSGNITNAGTIGSGAITSTGAVAGVGVDAGDGVVSSVGDIELDSISNEDGTLSMTVAASTGNVTFNGAALSLGAATGTSLDLGSTTLFASRAITVDTGGVIDINLGTASGDDFTIDTTAFVVEGNTGNVGIGTASPDYLAHINSAATPSGNQLQVQANAAGGISTIVYSVDNSSISFDAEYNSGYKSLDAGSSFNIEKYQDALTIQYGTAAVGAAVTFNDGIKLDVSGNIGLGVTPEGWAAGWEALQVGDRTGIINQDDATSGFAHNAYYDGSWKRIENEYATMYEHDGDSGTHNFYVAGTDAVDSAISWTTALTIENDGDISIGATQSLYFDGGSDTYVHEIAANILDFYTGGAQGMYMSGSNLNTAYSTNGAANMQINYNGYQNGSTQFRNFFIYDGKTANLFGITGSSGRVNVVNEFTAGTKTFQIDHPVVPTEKELYHMVIEGPRADLIYRGTGRCDEVVDLNEDSTSHPMLDGTFQALTQNAVVTSLQNQDSFVRTKPGEIYGALFKILCEEDTNDRVAWVVMAERADLFIKSIERTDSQGRLIPEHNKPEPDLTKLEAKHENVDKEEEAGITKEKVEMHGKGYYIHKKAYKEKSTERDIIKTYVAPPEPEIIPAPEVIIEEPALIEPEAPVLEVVPE